MNKLKLLIVAFVLSVLVGTAAQAQSVVPIQQVATRNDVCSMMSTSTAVNALFNLTLTPPNGQFVYLCGIDLVASQDATGNANTNLTFSTTGLNTWHYTFSNVSAVNTNVSYTSSWVGVVKSPTAGGAVTFTSPTAAAHTAYSINVYYYYAP